MKQTDTLPVFDETQPYTIATRFYREGFTAFQKKYVLRRSYIMMAIFAVLLISFVASAVSDPTNQAAYFLMVICLAAICMLWYNPRKQKRLVLEAIQELEGQQYTASCDGNLLRIRTYEPPAETSEDAEADEEALPIPETRLLLEKAWVQKMDGFYLVCDGKRMFYILPEEAIVSRETSEA